MTVTTAGGTSATSSADEFTYGTVDVPSTYNVGPGEPFTMNSVPWNNLQAGDIVNIWWQATPYNSKIELSTSGTAAAPIEINGIAGPNGQLPIIDGNNATTPPNASEYSYTPLQDLGTVIISTSENEPYGDIPSYINISHLQIQGADGPGGESTGAPGNTYTDFAGATRTYNSFSAGIYIDCGSDITLNGDIFTNNGLGLFAVSKGGDAISANMMVENCQIFGNGVVGDSGKHNTYTECLGITYQYNYFGPLCAALLEANSRIDPPAQ